MVVHYYRNILVKTVAPGAFETNFVAGCANLLESGDDELRTYSSKSMSQMWQFFQSLLTAGDSGTTPDPARVADKIYQCATSETPIHNIVGDDAEQIVNLKNSMPHQAFLDRMSEMLLPTEGEPSNQKVTLFD
ncbi:MAG: hypothetical protein J7642_06645 [Cyanobacteria bacterium SBC]|nr:hypothetical protein [Cyanobacteria bacterium SBC]